MNRLLLTILLASVLSVDAVAQGADDKDQLDERLENYLSRYKPVGAQFSRKAHLDSCIVDTERKTIRIETNTTFAEQGFTPASVNRIYDEVKQLLQEPYKDYKVSILTHHTDIERLIPNRLRNRKDKSRLWDDIDYDGEPWVRNVSCPMRFTQGLQGRHLALWASHGRYYDQKENAWIWQRPQLFGTTEDLFTQTVVVPYLIPMLERAGAVVFSPRERDWQRNEVIVDNDGNRHNYLEATSSSKWTTAPDSAFAWRPGTWQDGENPFRAGTARMAKTTSNKHRYSLACYQPDFPEAGRYAVYVSYVTMPNSIDDAHYTVWHKGEKTEFRVNQQMGGRTWVYLGTFDFDKGCNEFNRVVITNHSNHNGVVTTDAVRFGGGMGNIERGGTTSQLPRALEGARYAAQWAGMPYAVYSSKAGTNDYGDDINARSNMVNYLGGGSPYMPGVEGLAVPFELSLGVHSDAGYHKNGTSLIGSLSICTTDFNDGLLASGVSRLASRDYADALLDNLCTDLYNKYGRWNRRELYDRNYSETRQPEVPSAIIEMLSHQNFGDMRLAQDPNFRFTIARSLYKTTLRFVNEMHGKTSVVSPLAPDHFRITLGDKGTAHLAWDAVDDPQEKTATPTGYIVYTAIDGMDFDNGTLVRGRTSYDLQLEPDVLYHFKVAAVNQGGSSFTTETLSALYRAERMQKACKTILIVDGFQRLSSPTPVNTDMLQGFDMNDDPGVTLGATPGWLGNNGELTGKFIAGNNLNDVQTHARAVAATHLYSIVSASKKAVEDQQVDLRKYALIDLMLGLERNDGHSLVDYKTFRHTLQQQLRQYTQQGGALLVSGAYIGTDMTEPEERDFLAGVLKCRFDGHYREASDTILGMGTQILFHHRLNEEHYAATSADVLLPDGKAFTALTYSDGRSAGVAYQGNDYRTMTLGWPFECIRNEQKRNAIMKGILQFLIPQS